MGLLRRKPMLNGRLTAAEACALAGPALTEHDRGAGRNATLGEEDGRLVWSVATVAIGSGALVKIADSDGSVISVGRWGVR